MALPRQTIPIDFTGGLDKKADQKLVLPGKLTTLENGEFVAANTLRKRYGLTKLSTEINPTAGDAAGGAILTTLKDELISILPPTTEGGGQLVTYSESLGKWRSRGFVPLSAVTTGAVSRSTGSHSEFDAASYGAMSVWAWVGSGGVTVSVFDDTEQGKETLLVADYVLAASGRSPRLVVVDGKFCCFYLEGANLKMRVMDPATPDTWAAATTLKTDVSTFSTPGMMDACPGTALAYVAYCRSSDGGMNVFKVTSAGVVSGTIGVATNSQANINVQVFGSVVAVTIVATATLAINVRVYDLALAGLIGTANIAATAGFAAGDTVPRLASVDDSNRLVVTMEHVAAATSRRSIQVAYVDATGAIVGSYELAGNLGLAAAPFMLAGAIPAVAVVNSSTVQPTLFVLRIATPVAAPRVLARCLMWKAGGLHSFTRVAHAFTRNFGMESELPALERGRLAFSDGVNTTALGLTRVRIYTPDSGVGYPERLTAELDGSLFIASSCPSVYDGVGVTEHNFHLYPEGLSGTRTAGGSLPDGTYQICCHWEWVDGRGKLVRSIPSVPVTVVLSSGGSSRIIYSVPPLVLTDKTSPRAEVSVVFSRTEAGGSNFYRVSSVSSPTLNNPASTTNITLTDGTLDAALISNELLYTTGGVLERGPAPACTIVTTHQGRLFVTGLESGNAVAYSGALIDGEVAGFNEALVLRPQDAGGSNTGLASMDDKLLIARERRWEYISGEGPNALGQQNGYSEPQMATGELGAKRRNSRSLLLTDDGIWFRSDNGLRLLSRGLSIARDSRGTYLGSEVDGLVGEVLASLLDRRTNQLKFFDGLNAYVFDQQFRQWSKFTGHTASDAAEWLGVPAFIEDDLDGAVRLASSSLFTDDGAAIQFKLETGWLSVAGVQGFQRVYELMLLGTFYGAATLQVFVGYDFADAYEPAESIATGALYSTAEPLQLRYRLPSQKCEAIRFKVIESDGTAGGFALSSFALVCGIKRGAFKLAATKTVG